MPTGGTSCVSTTHALPCILLQALLYVLLYVPMQALCHCHQNPRQVTQEFCLRFVALLLVVLATVGLAYRLAKRDS